MVLKVSLFALQIEYMYLSWACCQALSGVSTEVHSVKHRQISSLYKLKASATNEEGVDLDKCTNLQKPPH